MTAATTGTWLRIVTGAVTEAEAQVVAVGCLYGSNGPWPASSRRKKC